MLATQRRNKNIPATPKSVLNFDLPNSKLNKNGPHLEILEQPQNKFRFRYKSEMVGTHGQLKAEAADKNKNVFPTVKLRNWSDGLALVRLMLYTCEDNSNERQRHVHELNGKNCNKDGLTGVCEVVVEKDNDFTAQFSNLGIIHIAKRDVQNIIFQRKKEEYINSSKIISFNTDSIHHNISPTLLQKFKEEAEEGARRMDLNKVVLRFQAFFYDTNLNRYQPITDPVDSDVILNLKNASTGELKIVRISAVSAPCSGGTEIWMLVEKVKKNNVRVKFYELDSENQEIWRDYGIFKESDVHHQYAIVFKTPRYRINNIREPVHVKLQLERTPDNDTSDPIDFTFLPQALKRSSNSFDSFYDPTEIMANKKPKNIYNHEAIDLKNHGNLFLGHGDIKQQPHSPEIDQKSPSHMVPSPMTPADSPHSQGFYSPPHHGHPTIMITENIVEDQKMYLNNMNHFGGPTKQDPMQYVYVNSQSNVSMGYERGVTPPNSSPVDLNYNPYTSNQMSPIYYSPSASVEHGSPNNANRDSGESLSPVNINRSPGSGRSQGLEGTGAQNFVDDALNQIRQFDAVQQELFKNKCSDGTVQNMYDFSNWVNDTTNNIEQSGEIDLLELMNNSKLFATSNNVDDIKSDCMNSRPKNTKTCERKPKNDFDEIQNLAENFAKLDVKKENFKNFGSNNLVSDLTTLSANSLYKYTTTGDMKPLLDTHRQILLSQDRFGFNSLHISILERNFAGLEKILKCFAEFSKSLTDDEKTKNNNNKDLYNLINSQDVNGTTPLHLSVLTKQQKITEKVLQEKFLNLHVTDNRGNTVLHVAALMREVSAVSRILNRLKEGCVTSDLVGKYVNLYNFNGQTALHMAIEIDNGTHNLEIVKNLVQHGADVHLCDKKQGANVLHIAAMYKRFDIAKFLIDNSSVSVNAEMFSGDTPLHIAAKMKLTPICKLFIQAKADPNILAEIENQNCDEDDD